MGPQYFVIILNTWL